MSKPGPIAITSERLAASGTEDGHQMALFRWAYDPRTQALYPEVKWLFAIPNGGWRDKRTAALMRATGVKRDVPDICLPIRRGPWQVLWIELKRPASEDGVRRAGNVRKGQTDWLEHLKTQGHASISCVGWEAARDLIIQYLEFKGVG